MKIYVCSYLILVVLSFNILRLRRNGKEDSGPGYKDEKEVEARGPSVVNEAFFHEPVAVEQNANDGNEVVGDHDILVGNDGVFVEEQDNKPTHSVPRDDTYDNQESKFLIINKKKHELLVVKFIPTVLEMLPP